MEKWGERKPEISWGVLNFYSVRARISLTGWSAPHTVLCTPYYFPFLWMTNFTISKEWNFGSTFAWRLLTEIQRAFYFWSVETRRWSEWITCLADRASKNILPEQRADPFVWFEKDVLALEVKTEMNPYSSSTWTQYMSYQITWQQIFKHLYSTRCHFHTEMISDAGNISFLESICSACWKAVELFNT